MPKHHGMLFADRLMPPLLSGAKTQTRLPINPQPEHGAELCHWSPTGWAMKAADGACRCKPIRGYHVGDLIWARECWAEIGDEAEGVPREFVYRADGGDYSDWESVDGDKFRWYPSIHMPRRACRCWLEITDVRVQRIQEISEEDAIAEGSETRTRFIESWSSIYPGSWERNDWVWALSFRRVDAPGGETCHAT